MDTDSIMPLIHIQTDTPEQEQPVIVRNGIKRHLHNKLEQYHL